MVGTETLNRVSFLPDRIRSHSKFSHDSLKRLDDIWKSYKTEAHFVLIKDFKRDLAILSLIERKCAKGSDNLIDAQLEEWISRKKAHIALCLGVFKQFFGNSLDSRVLHNLALHRKMARAKLYLESIGIGTADACIGAAACAVHLGCVPERKFGLSSANFKALYKAKNKAERERLAERVRKDCANYLKRSKQIRAQSPRYVGAPREGLEGFRYEVLNQSIDQFVESEQRYFPEEE